MAPYEIELLFEQPSYWFKRKLNNFILLRFLRFTKYMAYILLYRYQARVLAIPEIFPVHCGTIK
jgi:hypothetical protein